MTNKPPSPPPPPPLPPAAAGRAAPPHAYAVRGPQPQRPPVPPMPPRRSPKVTRGWSWLRIVLAGALGLAVLLAGGFAYLVLSPPVEFLKSRAIAGIKATTGRDLVISGPVSFSTYPSLVLKLQDLTLSGPPGMGPQPFAIAESVEARVALWPLLLQRRISVEQLILRAPVFDFRVEKSGRRSWDFAPVRAADRVRPTRHAGAAGGQSPGRGPADDVRGFAENASSPDHPSPQGRQRVEAIEGLALSDVRIEGGAFYYADERTGDSDQATAIDASVSLPSLQSELEATGTMTWSGQAVGFDLKLASPKALLEERPGRLRLALKAAPVDARYDGSLILRSGWELDGDVSAKGQSLRALMRWLGTELPPAEGFAVHSLDGKLRADGRGYQLSEATFALDGATATGTLAVDTTAERPKVTANLKVNLLDLNRYTLAAAVPVSARPKPGAKPAVFGPAVKTIEDLISDTLAGQKAAGPRVKGYAAREGWSSEPIRLDALGLVDCDLRLAAGGVRWREIKTGAAIVTVALKSKVLRVNLDDIQLYEGKGRGLVTIDANPQVPVFGANLAAEGVAGQPLLKDATGFGLVSGTAKLELALGAQGASELALVESMSGKAELRVANGAVSGLNIAGALRAVKGGQLQALKKAPTEKTDFAEMHATFAVKNGIATSQDLRMMGPLLRVGGAGQIALPSRTIDYTLRPRLVASLEGQGAGDRGAGGKLAGLEVPILVKGPLSDPDIRPDYQGLLKDQGKAVEKVKEIGKQLKASGILKSLIGRAKDGSERPPVESRPGDPKGDAQKPIESVPAR